MADAKITELTALATPANEDLVAVVDDVAGTPITKKATLADVKTLVNTDPDFAAGSAAAGTWPNLAGGTLLTTSEAGAIERDSNCFYMTTDPANRGYVSVRHFIRCDSARTLPNDTNLNAIFNSPANGRITLETGTYLFESLMIVTAMSATSGNALINVLGAGTATVGAWLWRVSGIDNTAPGTLLDDDTAFLTTNATAASAVTAATGTALRLSLDGTFEVTGAGTLIPSIDLVTAAAAVVSVGSYFLCERIGSTSVASVGQWD